MSGDLVEPSNSGGGQGLDGACGYGIDPDAVGTHCCGQVADTHLQGRLGDTHDVVVGKNFLPPVVGQGNDASITPRHERRGLPSQGNK